MPLRKWSVIRSIYKMKKITHKLKQKISKKQTSTPSRITNDTVAAHREEVLAGGRRFKYPIQYARHKLVINAIILIIVALASFSVFTWWRLYKAHDSSTFFYRVAQIVSLPVGSIDGESVYFRDYLLNYRVSRHYLDKYDQIKIDSPDGQLQLEYKKRSALDVAIRDAYARKVIREKNIKIDSSEIEQNISSLRNTANGSISQEASEASSQQVLGLSSKDLRSLIYNSTVRSKAAFAIDDNARLIQEEVAQLLLKDKATLKGVAEKMAKKHNDAIQYGVTGLIDVSSNFGGLQVAKMSNLEKGTTSSVLKSSTDDGYYFVTVLEKSSGQINFAYIHIPLTEFNKRVDEIKSNQGIDEYITIDIEAAQKRAENN